MKIKDICKITGLTDRTIRFYIEEKLISPFYTENYLGRRSFDFSDQDMERLQDIAVLRAFGFSVEEIKELSKEDCECEPIVKRVIARTGDCLEESRRRLKALSMLGDLSTVTITELARRLSSYDPNVEKETVTQDKEKSVRTWIKYCILFLCTWLPIAASVVVLALKLPNMEAPKTNPIFLVLTILCFVPSFVSAFAFERIKGEKRTARTVLTVLCALCLPLGIIFSFNSFSDCEHNYVFYCVNKEATCQTDGEILTKCENCDKYKIEITKKAAHTPHTVEGLEPTCFKDGYTESIYCSVCHYVIKEQYLIKTYGHVYKSRNVEQSCGSDGYTVYECKCGDSYKINVVRATFNHSFVQNPNGIDFKCSTCGLLVCEHGNIDGSISGGNDKVKYYITGPGYVDTPRTLVIYGNGDIPSLYNGAYPPWIGIYLYDIDTIIIEHGITSIGNFIFTEKNDISYENIKSFIIRSEHIDIASDDPRLSGLSCPITYEQ